MIRNEGGEQVLGQYKCFISDMWLSETGRGQIGGVGVEDSPNLQNTVAKHFAFDWSIFSDTKRTQTHDVFARVRMKALAARDKDEN